jgi:hypothetical protein
LSAANVLAISGTRSVQTNSVGVIDFGQAHADLVERTLWIMRSTAAGSLERDDFSLNHHPALAFCWSKIFSENRYPLFGIML